MADSQPKAPALPSTDTTTIGASGTQIYHGYITGEEYNKNLIGKPGIRVYEQMRRGDSTVHATLLVCKLPIIETTYDIQGVDDEDPVEKYKADFIRNELFDGAIVFDEFIREALSMFDFGFSVFEKTLMLKTFEGKTRIGIAKLGSRKQYTIQKWELDNGQEGVVQQLISSLAQIPREKLIIFTNEKEGDNYEGISLLRFAYKPWYMKDTLEIVNGIALERQGVGIPVLTTDMNGLVTAPSDKAAAENILRNIRANEEGFITKNQSMEVGFMDMKGNSTKEILPTIQYQDRQIVRSVLAQFLELGGNMGAAGGAKALSEDHSQLFEKSLQAVAKNLVASIQQQLINQLCDLNFTDMSKGYPKLIAGDIGDTDITSLASAVNNLMVAGALTPDPDMENHIRDVLHFPKLPEDKYDNFDALHAKPVTPAPVVVAPPTETPKPGDVPVPPEKPVKASSLIEEARTMRKRIINVLHED
jgi:hypothetical protein